MSDSEVDRVAERLFQAAVRDDALRFSAGPASVKAFYRRLAREVLTMLAEKAA